MERNVMSRDEPQTVELFADLAGVKFARLHKNIQEDWVDVPEDSEAEPMHFWKYDEAVIQTDLDEEAITEQFDQLWYEAVRGDMTDAEWRADIDSALLDLMEMVVM